MATVNGINLEQFGAKMLSYPVISACAVDMGVFQGVNRSSLQLLHNRRGLRKLHCAIDFFGSNYDRTMHQSDFDALFLGGEPVVIDIDDGFWYRAVLAKIGDPSTRSELITTIKYEFYVTRHRGSEITAAVIPNDAVIFCQSNVARTDCVIRILYDQMGGASNVLVELNGLRYSFGEMMTGDLVIDGVNKMFTMAGENVAEKLRWTDFPFLVPGDNVISLSIDGVVVSWKSASVTYTPTFL